MRVGDFFCNDAEGRGIEQMYKGTLRVVESLVVRRD